MSGETRRCTGCGAEAPRPGARFCEHCGAPLRDVAAPAQAPPIAPDPIGDVAARLAELARRPELEALLANAPDVPELEGKTLPSLLLLGAFSVLGLFASLFAFQLCPPLGFVPLVLVGVGVVVLARRLLWNVRTPMTARPALVVELRAKLQAGAEHSPAHTRHHATLALEDGTRVERECFASALGGLRVGALGVAYLKGDRLAAFQEVPDPGTP